MKSPRKPSQEPTASPRFSVDDASPREAKAQASSLPREVEDAAQQTAERDREAAKPEDDYPAETPISEEHIRWRAYELYLARGDAPGDALDDWLRAEREFRDRSRK